MAESLTVLPFLLLLSLAPALAADDARFRCEALDGSAVEGHLLAWSDGRLRVGTRDQGRVALDAVLIEALAPPPADPAAGPQDLLVLAPRVVGSRGDRLVGRLLDGDDVGLRWQLASGHVLDVPFDVIDRWLPAVDRPLDRLLGLPVEGFDDRLWRRREDGSLDAVDGVVAEVGVEGLVMETDLGELAFAWPDVLAAALSGTRHPEEELAGHPARVALVDGSVFEAGLLNVQDGRLVFVTAFHPRLDVPVEQVASLLLSDRADAQPLLLADLQPEQVVEWPSIGEGEPTLFPWVAGLAVAGGPLVTGGLQHASGWGVHAHCELGVRVPDDAAWLRVTVGLSDDVLALPAHGSVDVTLLLDGEPAGPARTLLEGQPPAVLRLERLRGGELLTLRVGDGGDHDAGDRVVWVDGLFGRR